MKKLIAICTMIVCMGESLTLVNANVFDMSGGQKSLEFVTVGNPHNNYDPYALPYGFNGTVHYTYKIGKFDVTAGQYTEFLNAVAKTDTYGLYNWHMAYPEPYYSNSAGCGIQQSGSPGNFSYSVTLEFANFPVNYVSWGDAVRFANWLNNGQPTGIQDSSTTEDGSYNLIGIGGNLQLVIRKPDAHYVIPTSEEWYKAGYYDPQKPGGPGYWKYPTRSDNVPLNSLLSTGTNNANFYANNSYSDPIYLLTKVGAFAASPGPYGTFDQGGNVFQWMETMSGDAYRFWFGGAFWCDASFMRADKNLQGSIPGLEHYGVSFRVAEMPTPVPAGVVLGASKLGQDSTGAVAGDPVNTATGNSYLNESDLTIPSPGMSFEFARAYNSSDSYSGPFGPGWTYSYNVFVQSDPCRTMVLVKWGDGQGHYYLPDTNDTNSYHPAIGAVYDKLKINPVDNTWLLTRKDQTRYNFNTSGKLTSIIDKNGNRTSLLYDGNSRLSQITDSAGRVITLVYAGGLVQSIADPNNRQITYGYTSGKLTSVTDANGNPEYYTYDLSNGKLKTITDRRGIPPTLNNVYDPNGRVIQQINGRGKISSFAYNTPGQNKATITDPLGRRTVHTYDPNLRLISITDPCGHTISYTYDNQSNRTSIIDQNGNTRYFTYDTIGNVLTMTAPPIDPNDPNTAAKTVVTYDLNTNNPLTKTEATGTYLQRIWRYEYDPNGNLTRTIDPNGYQSKRSYTANGLLASETDPNGHTTKYTYDAQGNLKDVNDALGNMTHYNYDQIGRMIKKTDACGNQTIYGYDKNNNLLTEKDPNGKTISYSYDKNNNKTSTTDKRGNTWRYEYNENNILIREVDPNGFDTVYGYDDVDNKISIKNKRGKTTKYTFDKLNRLIDVNDPLFHHTSYTYDPKGNRISQKNALGKTWQYKYDALDQRIEENDPLSNTTKYQYDLLGRKVAVTDARGNSTQYDYDVLDRLVQVTDAIGGITRYRYDPVGNLITIIDANDRESSRGYDALNRLISKSDPLDNTTQYRYDKVGNLIEKIDAMDRTTTYKYDNLDRLIEVNYSDGKKVTYSYDENNRIAMTDWNGSSSFGYDKLNRMTASTDTFGKIVRYRYDPAGNRTAVVYPDNKTVTYDYDNAGRLIKVTDWNSQYTSYTYDAANNLKSVSLPNLSQQLYDYDDAGRLISLQNKDRNASIIGGFEYTLDGVGNRLEIKETGTLKPLILNNDANYTYDDADRLVTGGSCGYNFNDNGDQTSRNCGGMPTQYTYDPKDLLIGVSQSGLNVQHTYDGLNNRIAKTTNGTPKRYVLDLAAPMSQVLCETDDTGNITAYYIYGAGLLAKITPGGVSRYYHYDGLGSTVALTDENGFLTDRYAYEPFGGLANSVGSTDNPFKYVGRLGVMTEPDGTLFMRARFYDPATGRFLSKDTVEDDIQIPFKLHRYIYASANPIRFTDPLGETSVDDAMNSILSFKWIVDPVLKLSGSIVSTISNVLTGYKLGSDLNRSATAPTREERGSASIEVGKDMLQSSVPVTTAIAGASALPYSAFGASLTPGIMVSVIAVSGGYERGQTTEEDLSALGHEYMKGNIDTNKFDSLVNRYLFGPDKNKLVQMVKQSPLGTTRNTSTVQPIPIPTSGSNIYIPAISSQGGATPKVNVPVIVSVNPQTYSQTYTSTTRKYK